MRKIWDHFEYAIAEHRLSAMVNGDFSGMDDPECQQYRDFERQAFADAHAMGWNVGHWAPVDGSGEDWGTCEICRLSAMRCTVRLMVWNDAE